ncbi:MAG: hypothetical protein ACOH5I_10245 [Oligoflexus sp.]
MLKVSIIILIALNLAVSSVPRCGMLRHVVQALLADGAHHDDTTKVSCHDHAPEKLPGGQSAITDDIFCPCYLAKFSYIWVLFDLSNKLNSKQMATPMQLAWIRLLAAFHTNLSIDTPPPRLI